MPYTAEEMHHIAKHDLPQTATEAIQAAESRLRARIAEECAQLADEAAGVPHGSRTEVSKAGAAIRRHFGLQPPEIAKPLPSAAKPGDAIPVEGWKLEVAHRASQYALANPDGRTFNIGTRNPRGFNNNFTFDVGFIRHSTTADIIEAIDSMLKKGA